MTRVRIRQLGGLLRSLEFGGDLIASAAFAIMTIINIATIITRYTMGLSLQGVYEATELLMVFVIYLTLANGQREKRQITVTFLRDKLGPAYTRFSSLMCYFIGFVVCGIFAWQTGLKAWESLSIRATTTGVILLPQYPSKICLFLGVLLLCAQYVNDFIITFRTSAKGKSQS